MTGWLNLSAGYDGRFDLTRILQQIRFNRGQPQQAPLKLQTMRDKKMIIRPLMSQVKLQMGDHLL